MTHLERSRFVHRALAYYHYSGFKGTIYLCDSSPKEHYELNKSYVKKFGSLNIIHEYFPKEKFPGCHNINQKIADRLPTELVTHAGDDDFVGVKNMRICEEFLYKNPEYIGAHGAGIRIHIGDERDYIYGQIHKEFSEVPGQWMDIDHVVFRFMGYMRSCTSPQFHLFRKDVFKYMYQYSDTLKNCHLLSQELVPCCLYVMSGKMKRFPDIVTNIQHQNPIALGRDVTNFLTLVHTPLWGEVAERTINILTEQLSTKAHIPKEEAWKIVIMEFNGRIQSHARDQFEYHFKNVFEKSNQYYWSVQEREAVWGRCTKNAVETLQEIQRSMNEYRID